MMEKLGPKWKQILKGLDLTFICGACRNYHTGDSTNNQATCPNCDEGILEPTQKTLQLVADKYMEAQKEHQQCL